MKALIVEFITPLPSLRRFVTAVAIGFTVLGVTTPILAFNEPAMVTSSYEVLEPETWVGKELPILEHIDIADQLEKGIWLILLYHYDCQNCITAIRSYEQKIKDWERYEGLLRIAIIEVPPYGQPSIDLDNPQFVLGKLDNSRRWFINTPVVLLVEKTVVTKLCTD